MLRLRFSEIEKVCAGRPELWQDIWRGGRLVDEHCEISKEKFDEVCQHHFGMLSPGELIHAIAAPIARVLAIVECSACAERRLALNTSPI